MEIEDYYENFLDLCWVLAIFLWAGMGLSCAAILAIKHNLI